MFPVVVMAAFKLIYASEYSVSTTFVRVLMLLRSMDSDDQEHFSSLAVMVCILSATFT